MFLNETMYGVSCTTTRFESSYLDNNKSNCKAMRFRNEPNGNKRSSKTTARLRLRWQRQRRSKEKTEGTTEMKRRKLAITYISLISQKKNPATAELRSDWIGLEVVSNKTYYFLSQFGFFIYSLAHRCKPIHLSSCNVLCLGDTDSRTPTHTSTGTRSKSSAHDCEHLIIIIINKYPVYRICFLFTLV